MKILFCGSLLPGCYEGKYEGLSAAGSQYQNNLIKALKSSNEVRVISFINYPVNAEYEAIRKTAAADGIECFFTEENRTAVLQFRKRMCELANWADVAMVYNVMYPWYQIGTIMRRKDKKSILILADYTGYKEQPTVFRKAYALLNALEFRKYGKVILLSAGMKKYITKRQSFSVINGCIDWEKFKDIRKPELNGTVNMVYTGCLSAIAGVEIMLEAFEKISDPNIRLTITGQGGSQKELANDPRVEYKGFVPRDEYYSILENAHILLSPRDMKYEQNTANFPSKVLEYMATGRYVVSTKFMGFENYANHFLFAESNAEDFCNCLKEAIAGVRKDCTAFYETNRRLAYELDWSRQADRFLDFEERE